MSLEAALLASVLGLLTGAVEIFSRYRHGFQIVLKTVSGWLYLLLNAVLGVGAYALLLWWPDDDPPAADHWKLALYAGLGAAALVRARLFTVQVGEKEVAFGPGYLVDKLLALLVREVDRAKDLEHVRLVRRLVADLEFGPAVQSARTVIRGMRQSLTSEEREALIRELDEIEASSEPVEEKTHALGFALLDKVGEKLLQEIVGEVRERSTVVRQPASMVLTKPAGKSNLVRAGLTGVAFDEAVHRFQALADQDTSLAPEDRDELLAEVDQIRRRDMPEADRSFALGFLAFDFFGREAFERHFLQITARSR